MIEMQMRIINFMLFFMLPLWGIAGFVDWYCHRRTKIEITAGIKESFLHSLMGIQVGIPIALCLMFQVNALILLICGGLWIMHEVIAHYDVHLASKDREISIMEVHAHNYLATIPLYMFAMVLILNWDVVSTVVNGNTSGQFTLNRLDYEHGGKYYIEAYYGFMFLIAVLPYLEEFYRCWRNRALRARIKANRVSPLPLHMELKMAELEQKEESYEYPPTDNVS